MIGTVSIQDRAKEAATYFTVKTRADGSKYVTLRDVPAPEWVTELVRRAHGDMLPDDYRYKMIREAVDVLAYANDDADLDELESEFADDVDLYTSDLTAWLGSHYSRPGYCDEAREELGTDSRGIVTDIQRGQYMERREVFHLVLEALREVDA